MLKGKWYNFLIVVGVVLSLVVFAALFFPVICFPVGLDVSGHVFHVGDKMSVTATVANKSGIDVHVAYGAYDKPCVRICNIQDILDDHPHLLPYREGVMDAGDKWGGSFEYEFTESGIYVVDAHCPFFKVNNYPNYHSIFNRCYDIVIVVD